MNDKFEQSQEYFRQFQDSLPAVAKPIGEILSGISVGSGEFLTVFPREENRVFERSQYFETKKTSFVHFTSLEVAINMLNEGFVRLGTLNQANDPQEVLFGMAPFHSLRKTHIELDNQKDIFSLSMCNEEAILDLNLWRLYGANGNGVAIHFDIENDPISWNHYHFSKVFYGKDNRESINAYLTHLESFPQKHLLYPRLIPLLAFHKSEVYRSEKEYRLLCYAPGGTMDRPNYPRSVVHHGVNLPIIRPKYSSKGGRGRYLMLPLGNCYSEDHGYFKTAPRISISQITLGFNFEEAQIDEILMVVNEALIEGYEFRDTQFRTIRNACRWDDLGEDKLNHAKTVSKDHPLVYDNWRNVEVKISSIKGQFRG